MKKRLLLDVDEVICFTGFLPLINEFMNTNYVIDDFKDYFIDEMLFLKIDLKSLIILLIKEIYIKIHMYYHMLLKR